MAVKGDRVSCYSAHFIREGGKGQSATWLSYSRCYKGSCPFNYTDIKFIKLAQPSITRWQCLCSQFAIHVCTEVMSILNL